MVEGCTTLKMKMKANNIIVTMQTNCGGKGKKARLKQRCHLGQKHTISFKIFFSQLLI
jgi:hypothetical protein